MNGCPAVSEIRQALAESVTTHLGPEGWRQSAFAPGVMGDPRPDAHLVFSITAESTEPSAGERQRPQRRVTVARTLFRVHWLHVLPVEVPVEAYDAALDAEERLVAAAIETEGFPVRLERIHQRRVSGTWLVGAFDLEVHHPLNLALAEPEATP